jgi:PST family polysaccharide transporter
MEPRPVSGEDDAQTVLTGRTINGLVWTMGGKISNAVLQLLVLGILARALSPAEFGLVGTAMIVIAFSTIFSRLGIGPAIVQREQIDGRHLVAGFAASVALGFSTSAAVWLIAPEAARFFRMPELTPIIRVLAALFPINALAVVPSSMLQRELRFRWLANVEVASYAIGYGLVVIALALAGWGVWALVAGQFAQSGFEALVLLMLRPPVLREPPRWAALRDLLYFGSGHTVGRIGTYLAHEVDYVVVGRWLGAEALGLYGRAYGLMAAPGNLLADAIDLVSFPELSRMQADTAGLRAAYRQGVALVALVVLPASVVLLVLAPEVVRVVLGEQWMRLVPIFQIFAIGMLPRASYKLGGALAHASGAVYQRAWRQALYAALVFIGALVGQRWGPTGAAAGVLMALTVNFGLMAQLCLRLIGMSWTAFMQSQRPALLSSAVLGAAVWIAASVAQHWAIHPVVIIITASLAGSVVMLPLLVRYPVPFLGRDGIWLVDLLRQRLLPTSGLPVMPPPLAITRASTVGSDQ